MSEQEERRNSDREPSMIEGYAEYGRFFKRAVPCLITEQSPRGARLWTNSMAKLPGRFRLYSGSADENGREVVAVWRNGVEHGVEFAAEHARKPAFGFAFRLGRLRTA